MARQSKSARDLAPHKTTPNCTLARMRSRRKELLSGLLDFVKFQKENYHIDKANIIFQRSILQSFDAGDHPLYFCKPALHDLIDPAARSLEQ